MRSNGRVLFWELLFSEVKVVCGGVRCWFRNVMSWIGTVMEKWGDVS